MASKFRITLRSYSGKNEEHYYQRKGKSFSRVKILVFLNKFSKSECTLNSFGQYCKVPGSVIVKPPQRQQKTVFKAWVNISDSIDVFCQHLLGMNFQSSCKFMVPQQSNSNNNGSHVPLHLLSHMCDQRTCQLWTPIEISGRISAGIHVARTAGINRDDGKRRR